MREAIEDESLLVRLRRDRAEADKLHAETAKLFAEQLKLFSEAQKLQRDRYLAPVIAVGGLIVGGLGIVAGILAALVRH